MNRYYVRVTEQRTGFVYVNAETEEAAKVKARKKWNVNRINWGLKRELKDVTVGGLLIDKEVK